MPALIDLTGRTFGRWAVLRRDPHRTGRAYWVCRCECGRVKSIAGNVLRDGESSQCRACSGGRAKPVYSPGDRVGEWTIKDGPRKADGKYSCMCSCGSGPWLVQVGNLRSGTSTRCGRCRESARR